MHSSDESTMVPEMIGTFSAMAQRQPETLGEEESSAEAAALNELAALAAAERKRLHRRAIELKAELNRVVKDLEAIEGGWSHSAGLLNRIKGRAAELHENLAHWRVVREGRVRVRLVNGTTATVRKITPKRAYLVVRTSSGLSGWYAWYVDRTTGKDSSRAWNVVPEDLHLLHDANRLCEP